MHRAERNTMQPGMDKQRSLSFDYIHSVLRSKGVFGDFVKYHQCSMEKYPVSLGVSGSSSDDARRIALMG